MGCGDGLFFHRLLRYGAVEGLESDATIVTDEGRRWGKIHVGPFDGEFQPAKRYSLILMLDVLEHLPDPMSALTHALELLEPEGILLITVPAFQTLWTTHDDLNHHLVRYTRTTFRSLAASAAMRIDEMRYFNHWLFPAKLAVRVKERIWPSAPRLPQVPSTLVNVICSTLARIEAALCSRWPLPFGGSLLVVGGALSIDTLINETSRLEP